MTELPPAVEFGVDVAASTDDKTGLYIKIDGATYIRTMPKGIGNPIKLELKNDRVICRTESGITMIVSGAKRAS